jgi:hypothetical protein
MTSAGNDKRLLRATAFAGSAIVSPVSPTSDWKAHAMVVSLPGVYIGFFS